MWYKFFRNGHSDSEKVEANTCNDRGHVMLYWREAIVSHQAYRFWRSNNPSAPAVPAPLDSQTHDSTGSGDICWLRTYQTGNRTASLGEKLNSCFLGGNKDSRLS